MRTPALPANARAGGIMDLQTAIEAWLASRQSPGTRLKYGRAVEEFLAFARTRPGRALATPSDLTSALVQSWWWALERKHGEPLADGRVLLTRKTAQSKFIALQSFLSWCQDEGLVTKNVAKPILRGKRVQGRPRAAVGLQVVKKVLAAAMAELGAAPEGHAYRVACAKNLAVSILAATGMRINELVCLRVCDYDGHAGTLTILGKGNKLNRILVPASLCWLIELFIDEFKLDERSTDQLVAIPGYERASPNDQTINRWIRELCDAAGVGRMTAHQFRSTIATELAQLGTPLVEIGRLLGHSMPQTTARYVHLVDEKRQAAALRIDVLGGGQV